MHTSPLRQDKQRGLRRTGLLRNRKRFWGLSSGGCVTTVLVDLALNFVLESADVELLQQGGVLLDAGSERDVGASLRVEQGDHEPPDARNEGTVLSGAHSR